MEIDWKRFEARLPKRTDVNEGGTLEENEAIWQHELKYFEQRKEQLEKFPVYSAIEAGDIRMRVEKSWHHSPKDVWFWRIDWTSTPRYRLLNADSHLNGWSGNEEQAKLDAMRGYLKVKAVKDSIEAIRKEIGAKWGGVEEK